MRTLTFGAIFASVLFCAPLLAQAPEALIEPVTQAPPAIAQVVRIPAGTVIEVELTEALSSKTSRQQQLFGLRVVEPIVLNGQVVVPAGAPGGGEVIDAFPSAFGGRQGRLIISGRYVEVGGKRARIRGMQITVAGKDRGNAALAVGVVAGVAGFLVQGGDVEVPVGARGVARLAEDVELPASAAPVGEVQAQQEKDAQP